MYIYKKNYLNFYKNSLYIFYKAFYLISNFLHLYKAFLHFYKDIYLLFKFKKKKHFLSGCNINGAYKLKELKLNKGRIKRYN